MRSMIGFSVCSELLDELEFANDGPCTHTPPKRFQLVYEMADCHKNFQKKPNRRILVTAPCPRGQSGSRQCVAKAASLSVRP